MDVGSYGDLDLTNPDDVDILYEILHSFDTIRAGNKYVSEGMESRRIFCGGLSAEAAPSDGRRRPGMARRPAVAVPGA